MVSLSKHPTKRSVLLPALTLVGTGGWIGFVLGGQLTSQSITTDFPWPVPVTGLLIALLWGLSIRSLFTFSKAWKGKSDQSKTLPDPTPCKQTTLMGGLKELHELIAKHLGSITAETDKAALTLIEQLSQVHEDLQKLEEHCRQPGETEPQMLSRLRSSLKEIKSKTNSSLMTLQFQDITQQQIEVILKSLQLFEKRLSEIDCILLGDEKNKHVKQFDIDEIRDLYVMKKQFDIHDDQKRSQNQVKDSENPEEDEEITIF